MNRQKLVSQIRRYVPYNEQEEADKALILNWIEKNDDAFLRDNVVAHMTASAWVVDKDRSKVLMVYHNIYHSWSWLGGHADGGDRSSGGCNPGGEGRSRNFRCAASVGGDFFAGIAHRRRTCEKKDGMCPVTCI